MGPQAAIGGGGGSEGSCMVLRALAAICVIKRKTSELKPHSSFGIHGTNRYFFSVGEWPLHMAVKCLTVSLPKPPVTPPCNGRFTSETAVWRFRK